MIFKTGDIFWADIPKENKINGSRPVVILENIGDDNVKIIPISSNIKYTNKSCIAVNLLLNDKVSYVSLLPDRVTIIPKKWLKTQVGSVNNDIMQMLLAMAKGRNISIMSDCNTESNNNSELIIFDKSMDSMKPYIVNSNKILNEMISKKSLVVNIIVAIITGIIASLITNYLWLAIAPN